MEKKAIKNIITNNPIIHNGWCWVSDVNRLVYVGIPKNASSSIRAMFSEESIDGFFNNFNIPKTKEDYKKFTIIREPINRFVSSVYESFNRIETPKKIMQLMCIKNTEELLNKYLTILENDGFIEIHTSPQIAFVCNKDGSFFDFDRILIFENLVSEFNNMCYDFNIKNNLKHINRGNKQKNEKTLELIKNNNKLKSRIEHLYKYDIEFYKKSIINKNKIK